VSLPKVLTERCRCVSTADRFVEFNTIHPLRAHK